MKTLRWILPGLALAALLSNGCIIISAQVFAHFALTNPFFINSPPGKQLQVEHVNLATVKEWNDNKAKLKGLNDVEILGTFKNLTGPAGAIELWITPGTTNLATYAAVTGGATKLWGPGALGAAPSSRTVKWADSVKLFSAPGKAILIDQVLHGGVFTVYVVSSGNAGNQIEVDNGEIVLVISAAK